MNEPIAAKDALRLIELALKQTEGFDGAGCCHNCNLARATMRPMLEYFTFGPWPRVEVHPTDSMHSFLAALRDHYDAVRPGWRESK